MKGKKKATNLFYFGFFNFALCVGLIEWLNIKFHESWKLFYYDVLSGFIDNGVYLKYLIVGFTLILIGIFYCILNIKGRINLQWNICIGKYQIEYHSCQWLKKKTKGIIILSAIILFVCIYSVGRDFLEAPVNNLWEGDWLVGHAFGAVDGKIMTESQEAFLENYEAGTRTFEVDFQMTSDDKVVLRHDWDWECQQGIAAGEIATEEKFLSVPIHGIYTPLSFGDLCLLMKEYPDIWVVTDSKYSQKEDVEKQFRIMLETAREVGAEEVLDRLIIQIYNEEMYEVVKEIYPFKSYIFTMYMRWDDTKEQFVYLCRWCVENDVPVITLGKERYGEEVQQIADRYHIDIYVHTENDVYTAREFLEQGVRGVYTDMIRLEELEENK